MNRLATLPDPPRRRWPLALLAGVAVVLALLLWLREPLADRLWPETRVQQLNKQAQRALAADRLTASDGSGARELYEAAIALDPDATLSREGLANVAIAALRQAEQAARQSDFAKAHAMLDLAQSLSAPREQWRQVDDAVRQREVAHAGLDGLMRRADAAHRAGQLEGEEGALPLYARILELDARHVKALEGREDALSDILVQAHSRLDAGDLREAAQIIGRVRGFDAGHVGLPDAEARLSLVTDAARNRAQQQLDSGALEQAAASFGGVLAVLPEDPVAREGVTAVATALALRADGHAAEYAFAEAEADLQRARALQANAPGIAAAEQHLLRARSSRSRQSGKTGAAQLQRVQQLLAEAEQAEQRGDLLLPPGDSAYDKLRAARALAPDNGQVQAALRRLLPAARGCFERELRNNSLGKARACLDAWSTLEGNSALLRSERQRLAARWVAVGNERLGGGDVAGARVALQSASAIDPAAPGLQDFSSRLQTAASAQP